MTSLILPALLLAIALPASGELDLTAPNPTHSPVNQLKVSGNACGPAALLNAFGFGSAKWLELATAVPGKDDRSRLTYVIRGYGLRQSSHLDRLRWTKTTGVNLLDLTDMGNEMRGSRWMPKLRSEVLLKGARESDLKLLRRIHDRLAQSMKKGLPPIVSLQRLAASASAAPGPLNWRLVHGHFIVITALPSRLDRNANSFPFRYVDPLGGKILEGRVCLDPASTYPAALVSVPQSEVGKRYLKSGERSIISLAAALGAF